MSRATFAIAALAVALANLALFVVTRRLNWRDTRPTPRPVTISFAVFALILLAVGGALLVGIPNVMPWLISRDTAVLIGWIFLGDAFYFLYAIARPRWSNAAPQLWSFLAYDLMPLPPLALHAEAVAPHLRTNLTIYLAVLIFSGALAVHYLLLYPATRLRGRRY